MTTIAFIGLGIMGGPMAGHLVKAGHDVVGYNRSRPPVDRLVEAGGRGADSIAEAVARGRRRHHDGAGLARTSRLVALGEDGIFANGQAGHALHRLSSIRPDVAASVAAAGQEAGHPGPRRPGQRRRGRRDRGHAVDHGRRRRRRLRRRRSRSWTSVGKTIVHVGPAGAGQTVKAANQLIVAGTIELVAEAIVFLEAYGVDMEAALEVLAGGLAGSQSWTARAPSMLEREFAPGFRIDLHHKDMGIVTSAAREAGVAIPLGRAHRPAGRRRCGPQGDGGLDHSALLLRRRAALRARQHHVEQQGQLTWRRCARSTPPC